MTMTSAKYVPPPARLWTRAAQTATRYIPSHAIYRVRAPLRPLRSVHTFAMLPFSVARACGRVAARRSAAAVCMPAVRALASQSAAAQQVAAVTSPHFKRASGSLTKNTEDVSASWPAASAGWVGG